MNESAMLLGVAEGDRSVSAHPSVRATVAAAGGL
jgi:hypothetical protein